MCTSFTCRLTQSVPGEGVLLTSGPSATTMDRMLHSSAHRCRCCNTAQELPLTDPPTSFIPYIPSTLALLESRWLQCDAWGLAGSNNASSGIICPGSRPSRDTRSIYSSMVCELSVRGSLP